MPEMYLQCQTCKKPVTNSLQLLTNHSHICREDEEDYIPAGYYVYYQDVVKAKRFPYSAPEEMVDSTKEYILFNLNDLYNTQRGRGGGGCCGSDGSHMNIECSNGHPIGMEHSDCWMPHFARVPVAKVNIISVTE